MSSACLIVSQNRCAHDRYRLLQCVPIMNHIQPFQVSWTLQVACPTWRSCTPGTRLQCRWGLRWSQTCRCPGPGMQSWPGVQHPPSHCTLTGPLQAHFCVRLMLGTVCARPGRALMLGHSFTLNRMWLMMSMLTGRSGQTGAVKVCGDVRMAPERQSQTEGQRPPLTVCCVRWLSLTPLSWQAVRCHLVVPTSDSWEASRKSDWSQCAVPDWG